MHLLLIDNFDSFTWNLAQLFMTLDCRVSVRRNTTPLAELIALAPDALLISPGPGTPHESGVSMEALRHWMHRIPVLGVCLGMQVINECFDGRTVHAAEPVHGKTQPLRHDGSGVFAALPSPFRAARYHSLAVERHSDELIEQAWTQDGTVMALRHASLPLHGVQFHPESFLTEHGESMARNFLALVGDAGGPETGRAVGSALQDQDLQGLVRQKPPPRVPDEIGIGSVIASWRWSAAAEDLPAMSAAAFAEKAHRRADGTPHLILLSGGEHDCSRRSIAFLRPAAILRAKNGRSTLTTADSILHDDSDPFALLRMAHDGLMRSREDASSHTHAHAPAREANAPPFPSPMISGYVAYEAAREIETLPAAAHDELALPDMFFLWPTEMLIRSHDDGAVTRLSLTWRHDGALLSEITAAVASSAPEQSSASEQSPEPRLDKSGGFLRRSFSRRDYEDAVRRVRRHIRDGDVYQVNLSQRFVFPLREHPFRLWLRLFAANPAPFYAYVDAGDHRVLSTSMERLFRIARSDLAQQELQSREPEQGASVPDEAVESAQGQMVIETRPIKGTRPRGATAAEDARLERELASSAKDDAELSMIVDLARNDIGHVCRAGSVRVAEHKRIERYANVMHLVSVVRGTLRADADIAAVFRALLPGGSITGCPKIRAMEIIDALEPVTRHVYTGSIGMLAADGTADFSIAIRTAVAKDNECHLSVGGGIVYDSDPAAEYAETLDKGATFFRLAGVTPHFTDAGDAGAGDAGAGDAGAGDANARDGDQSNTDIRNMED